MTTKYFTSSSSSTMIKKDQMKSTICLFSFGMVFGILTIYFSIQMTSHGREDKIEIYNKQIEEWDMIRETYFEKTRFFVKSSVHINSQESESETESESESSTSLSNIEFEFEFDKDYSIDELKDEEMYNDLNEYSYLKFVKPMDIDLSEVGFFPERGNYTVSNAPEVMLTYTAKYFDDGNENENENEEEAITTESIIQTPYKIPVVKKVSRYPPTPQKETKCKTQMKGIYNMKTGKCDIYYQLSAICIQLDVIENDDEKNNMYYKENLIIDDDKESFGCDSYDSWNYVTYKPIPMAMTQNRGMMTTDDDILLTDLSFSEVDMKIRSSDDPYIEAILLTNMSLNFGITHEEAKYITIIFGFMTGFVCLQPFILFLCCCMKSMNNNKKNSSKIRNGNASPLKISQSQSLTQYMDHHDDEDHDDHENNYNNNNNNNDNDDDSSDDERYSRIVPQLSSKSNSSSSRKRNK